MKLHIIISLLVCILSTDGTSEVNKTKLLQVRISACGPKGLCHPDEYLYQIDPPVNSKYCSPCNPCYCDEWCDLIGDCCPDLQLNVTPGEAHARSHKLICTDRIGLSSTIAGKTPNHLKATYPVIMECPANYSGEDIIKSCEKDVPGITNIPITSSITRLPYKNIHCLICNGEDPSTSASWLLQVSDCSPMLYYFQSAADFRDIVQNESCSAFFVPDVSTRICGFHLSTKCDGGVDVDLSWACRNIRTTSGFSNYCLHCQNRLHAYSDCNVTGNWETYDESLMAGCHSTLQGNGSRFKTLHCSLCNMPDNMKQICFQESYIFKSPIMNTIFNLEFLFDVTEIDGDTCKDGSILDPHKVSSDEHRHSLLDRGNTHNL